MPGTDDISEKPDETATADSRARQLFTDGEVGLALELALDTGNWLLAAEVVEGSWPRLVFKHSPLLRRAFASVPHQTFDGFPGARALREVMFPVGPRIEGRPPSELPEDPDELHAIAVSDGVADALRAGVACLIALRLRDDWSRTRNQAIRLSVVLEVAKRTAFDKVANHVAGIELQVAIALFLVGESVRAIRHATRAHRLADLDPIGYVERDAAGKLALIHAIRGDIHAARRWLDLSDGASKVGPPMDDAIESSRATARALVAAETLDRSGLAEIITDLEWGVGFEELWAIRLHAIARIGLLHGDIVGLRRLLTEAQAVLPYARKPSPPVRELLLIDSIDIAIAAGEGSRAAALLATADQRWPFVAIAEARLRLLSGDSEESLDAAQRALGSDRSTSKIEVAALTVSALALERLGHRDRAESALRMATMRATASGSIAAFAMVPGDELAELAAATGHELPDGIEPLVPSEIAVVELSSRETAVLQHLAADRSLAEIAELDFVSINTVKTQIRSLYRKLDVENRSDAVDAARTFGLI